MNRETAPILFDIILALGSWFVITTAVIWALPSFGIAFWQASLSLPSLLLVDGPATTLTVVMAVARLACAVAPCVAVMRAVPLSRRLWVVPILIVLLIAVAPVSLASCRTPGAWLLLTAVSLFATMAASRVWWLRWTCILPFIVLSEAVPRHALAGVRAADPGYRTTLLEWCQSRDGEQPSNLTVDHLMPYHGITVLDEDRLLLSGEGPNASDDRTPPGSHGVCSWWMRRGDDGYRFELPSDASGNLWRGCLLDGTIWMARANFLVGARRTADDGPQYEEVYRLPIPSRAMDYGEVACDPAHRTVWVTEAIDGGIWEVDPERGRFDRYEVGGMIPFPKRRPDGKLVISTTGRLIVFDPEQKRELDWVGAGIAVIGFDVCPVDGSVAVADAVGRLRIYAIDETGRYRFQRGASLFAPRRVA